MKILIIAFFVLTTNLLAAQSWHQVPVNTSQKLNEIDFPSSTVGYIVGDSATLLKSIDGGETWVGLALNGITVNSWSSNIVDVDFVDEMIGYIVFESNTAGIYKTIDGGLNWTDVSNTASNMCYKNSIYVNSETDFFLGGAGCFQSGQIEHFIDPTWNYSTVNYESWDTGEQIVDIDFNNGVGIAAMRGLYFLRSTDNGATWDSIPSSLSGQSQLTSVLFASADTIYGGYQDVSGGGFALLRSLDAGLTWGPDFNSGSFFYPAYLSLGQSSNGDIYTGGRTMNDLGIMFETTNGPSHSYVNINIGFSYFY